MRKRAFFILVILLLTATCFGSVNDIVQSSGVKGGVIVHLGCGNGKEAAELLINDRYIVQGLDVDPAKVAQARQNLLSTGVYGQVSVSQFDGQNLPYVDNLVNLLIVGDRFRVSDEEITRVLVPQGVALVDGRKIVKPWPSEIDQWTHFLHGPDNNAVARDTRIGAPRCIQWTSPPRWGRSHEELASMSAAVSANGRVFFIVDKAPLASIRFMGKWELVARDAFNGKLLWERRIDKWNDHLRHFRSGPLHLPRRLVAVGDSIYVTLGIDAPVSKLDAATGKVLKVYEGTKRAEEILIQDGIMYLAVGTSEINRTGGGLHERGEPEPTDYRYIAAIDTATGKQLWKKSFGDEYLLPLSLTVRDDSVYCQTTAGIRRLDAKSAGTVWMTPRLTPARRMSFAPPTIVATDKVLLCADRAAGDNNAARGAVEWGVHGWNEPGFPRRSKSILRAYSVETGDELWNTPCSEDYNSAVDVFVIGDTVWVGADFKGYDLRTGKLRKDLAWKGDRVGMTHHRCYRNKASERFIFTGRSGIEVVSLVDGWQGNNSWIRGTCQYGIMPANGLLYAPPDACACFPKVKVPGIFAAAPQRGKDNRMTFPDEPVLHKGPAFGSSTDLKADDDDWPMYRGDISRAGASSTDLPQSVQKKWSTQIGGRLTQPIIVGSTVFVAATDSHTLYAVKAADGAKKWSFTAGGRIDSSPTVHKGLVFFGCADGWIYALDASSGTLAWRFRTAPAERIIGSYDQLESAWPVHGAVLVQNDVLYAAAGRSTYLDCGIVLYRLNPLTGKQLSATVLSDRDPETGRQTGEEPIAPFDMEGSSSDILSGDGESVFMKHLQFDAMGNETDREKPHLFSITGFLGEEWFVRSYWLIGTGVGAGWGHWADAANQVPAGRILCFDEEQVYGYGRKRIASGAAGHKLDTYHIFAADKVLTSTGPGRRKSKRNTKGSADVQNDGWSHEDSIIVRAMVLTPDKIVVAGPPDLRQKAPDAMEYRNEPEALAAFRGRKGVLMQVLSKEDGSKLSECKLDAMPVFDGMSAASGSVFVSLKDGTIQCWGP